MEIDIKNFRSIKQCKYTFSHGVTLINGPSGKGKSTIFEAIKWCLYGSTKNVHPLNIKDKPNNFTKVKLNIANLEITRTKPPEHLSLIAKELTLEGKEADNYIQKNVGSKHLWESTSYVTQGERNSLFNLSNTDKLLLMKEIILDKEEEISQKYKSKIIQYLNNIDIEIIKFNTKIEFVKSKLDNDKSNNKELLNELELAKKSSNLIEKKHLLIDKIKEIDSSLEENRQIVKNNKNITNYKSQIKEAEDNLKNYPFDVDLEVYNKMKKYHTSVKKLSHYSNFIYSDKISLDELISIKNTITNNKKLNIESDDLDKEKKQLEREIKLIKEYLENEKVKNKYDHLLGKN